MPLRGRRQQRGARDRWVEEQIALPVGDVGHRYPRIAPEAVRLAIERSHQLDVEERLDRELLRHALRWLVESLTLHVECHYKVLLEPHERRFFSVAGLVNDLVDLLLELNALDLAGIASVIRGGDHKKIRAAFRQRARRRTQLYGILRPPQLTVTPAPAREPKLQLVLFPTGSD